MPTNPEDLKDTPYGNICAHLSAMAQDVLDAKARYDTLIQEQRAYVQARELKAMGLWTGDKVQFTSYPNKGKKGVIVGWQAGCATVELVKADGTLTGKYVGIWQDNDIEKLD